MHKLGLRVGVEHHRPEIDQFHAHGLVVEFGADRVLHPAVGNQNPQRAEVGTDGHQERHHQVLRLGQAIPAEEEQADHGGFEEEGHHALDRQWRTEDVTDVMRVVGPVGAELKLQCQACGYAQREVDAEQLAPESCHVFPDDIAGHHIHTLHDDQQPDHTDRQWHKQEVVERSDGKLQA